MKLQANGVAPSLSRYRMGAKNGLVAQAWQYVWDRLDTSEYRDAVALAEEAATVFKILPDSVRAHMYAMAREGILETEVRDVSTEVTRIMRPKDRDSYQRTFTASRKRTFCRIAPSPKAGS